MKINTLPTNRALKQGGFTLIEMIGVLAVIAILAALLIPKVFSAIADAKINNAVVSVDTIKTAVADHYGKYGRFDTLFGTTNLPAAVLATNYDTAVLMTEGLIDKPFTTKLGTAWNIQVRQCTGSTTVGPTDGGYSLDGYGSNNVSGQWVVEAVMFGVPEVDAQAVSSRIDGTILSAASASTAVGAGDLKGRVKYDGAAGGPTTVYVYLTHR